MAQDDYVKKQLDESLFPLSADEVSNIIIAYEPIWAIGTGLNATTEQAQQMHAFIRKQLADKYGTDLASQIRILYGGSCKPDNAKELFACPDVDGGLIGGASLKANDFIAIINAAQ
jgi:triosephosphate isomerase